MVVRSINHHLKVKKRERVKPEMLNVLVSLKLYHLDNPKDIATAHLQALNNKNKKKREEMSKKERKMAKNRAKLGMYDLSKYNSKILIIVFIFIIRQGIT